MGTRIVKVVGYGLTGLSIDPENYMLTNDPRINPSFPAFSYEDPEVKDSDASYMEHLRSKTSGLGSEEFFHSPYFSLIFPLRELEKSLEGQEASESFTMQSHIVYDGEYGDPGTLLIIPPGMQESWYRYGDHIDGLESFLEDEDSMEAKIQTMNFSPYPFDGMMDARTGEKISMDFERKLRSIKTLEKALSKKTLKDESRQEVKYGLKILQADAVKAFKFTDYVELSKNIVPLVPIEVQDLVEWSGIFRSPETWKDLRPMLYTYWS
jgi:hypothetical protein